MLWLVIPAIGLAGKLAYDALKSRPATSTGRHKGLTTLERNLQRLEGELQAIGHGRVAVIGQPGAGKSSLIRKMTHNRVRPLPKIGAQTDATNWSQSRDVRMVFKYRKINFIDVPGYNTETHPADVMQDGFPFWEIDVFIFVLAEKLRDADEEMFRRIALSGKPVCVCYSFADNHDDAARKKISRDVRKRLHLARGHALAFFSNKTEEGIEEIFMAIDELATVSDA